MASSRFLRHQRPNGTPVAVMWKDMTDCLLLDVTYREMAIWSEMTMNQNHVLLRFFRNGHWNHLKSSPNPQQCQLQTKLSPSVRGTFCTASAASSLRAHRGSPHPITTDGFASAARAALCGAGCLSKNAWCILCMWKYVRYLYLYIYICHYMSTYTYIWINHNIQKTWILEIKKLLG